MKHLYEEVRETCEWLQSRWKGSPKIGLILGTGLGDLSSQIVSEAEFPYRTIPNFPESTSPSHAGQLCCGTLFGVPVMVMEGRFHYYEGYSLREVTFPVRVMKQMGVSTLILTSAVGGMNPQYELSDIVIVEDHINLLPDNPLRGPNDDRLGPRFPDMSQPYDQELIQKARQVALDESIQTHKGVLVAVAGPNLETRAEYRMLRQMGADIVGMSTIPESIVAAHAGLRTLAFSVVTDMCLPDALEPAEISRIIAVANEGGTKLCRILKALIPKI